MKEKQERDAASNKAELEKLSSQVSVTKIPQIVSRQYRIRRFISIKSRELTDESI